ncbi:MAG: YceI family protein [Bacteroidales bacterium]|nr:YceI family protein [Bacteroidales bacterium]
MKTTKLAFAVALFTVASFSFAQEYQANTAKSSLKWTGKKITGSHWGYINLKEGSFTVKSNKIVNGTFTIDMNSMSNVDIDNPDMREKLIGHLKSDDFFGVDKFPVATLVITESSPFNSNVSKVKGKLTIKGITHPVSFDVTKNGNNYTSTITVDRSLYDVRYGSGKFFDNLGDNTIYDEFTLEVNIAAL